MVIPAELEKTFLSIEGLIHEISEALVLGDPQALALGSSHMRQGAVELSQLLSKLDSNALSNSYVRLRLKKIASNLASRRECLLRQSGVVERSLHLLIPASRNQTYAKAASPYGPAGKSSGTFSFSPV